MKQPTLVSSSTTRIRMLAMKDYNKTQGVDSPGGYRSFHRWETGNRHRLVREGWSPGCSAGQRVPKPADIVALREIRSVMGAAAFGSGKGTGNDGFRDIQQRLKFKGLDKIRVEHSSLVVDRHRSSTGLERFEG